MDHEAPSKDGTRINGEDRSAQIAALLEEEIVFGRLHPHQRLIEEDIAARFEAKRHVVRAAIAILERLGLVDRVRNRGAVVRLYTSKEVRDINAVRELLETRAAQLIPLPLPRAAIAELSAIQGRHETAVEAGDRTTVFRENIAFHNALFGHCGNDALIEAISLFAQKSHAYRSIFINDKTYLRWAAAAHRDMVRALCEGDSDRLVALCREHLAPAATHYIETYEKKFL